jgi:NAD-dependent protein deacetylase/lipoamidase
MREYTVIDTLKDTLKRAEKIVFLTGAGISQESGIGTFRGNDGLWEKYDPMKLASAQAFRDDPRLVWRWYNDRRRKIMAVKPNPGHMAIASLQSHRQVWVLTQNIDGLHHGAGSREVTELHGNIFATKCTKCDFKGKIRDEFPDRPPSCKICGSNLRPDVVWFGEGVKREVWNQAIIHSMSCDAMIIVGASLAVSPANTLPLYAKNIKATLIEVNPENTPLSNEMDFSIRKTAVDALPKIVSIFESLN